jgi:hypothetical protein
VGVINALEVKASVGNMSVQLLLVSPHLFNILAIPVLETGLAEPMHASRSLNNFGLAHNTLLNEGAMNGDCHQGVSVKAILAQVVATHLLDRASYSTGDNKQSHLGTLP